MGGISAEMTSSRNEGGIVSLDGHSRNTRRCQCGSPLFWNSIMSVYALIFPKTQSFLINLIKFFFFWWKTQSTMSGQLCGEIPVGNWS